MKKRQIVISVFALAAVIIMGTTAFAVSNNNQTTFTAPVQSQVEIDKLTKELLGVNTEESLLDLKEDELELSYRKGEIDYSAFKEQYSKLDEQDRALDLKENELEKKLKVYTGNDYYDDQYDNDFDDQYDNDRHDDNDLDDRYDNDRYDDNGFDD